MAVLFLLVLLAFWPALRGEFLDYDEGIYIIKNAHVRTGLSWANVAWSLSSFECDNWHPVTWWSHMLDCQIYGLNPWGHHLSSVLIHAINSILLFIVLRRLTGSIWRSWVVAALFGLHPLRVESVAWISERKDVLCGMFWMLTLWAYAKYAASNQQGTTTPRRWSFYGLSFVFCVCALMSKTMAATLPFVLLLLDYWPLQRISNLGSKPTNLTLEKVPFFLASLVACVLTYKAQKSGGMMNDLAYLSFPERAENALVSYARYLGKLFWPQGLCQIYPHPGYWPALLVVFAAVVILGISLLAFAFRHYRPYLLIGWLWYLGTLVPVIGLVQVGHQSIADRYSYLPSIGVLIAFVWGIAEIGKGWRFPAPSLPALAGAAALVCVALTRHQCTYWKDDLTVCDRALAVTTDNFSAHMKKGRALGELGRFDEAVVELQEAARLKPQLAEVHHYLAFALGACGRNDDAIAEYQKTLEIDPGNPIVEINLASLLVEKGRLDEAIVQYQKALKVLPSAWEAYDGIGSALLRERRVDEALSYFRDGLKIEPDNPRMHQNVGVALYRKGRLDEAISELREAVRLYKAAADNRPDSADAYINLAISLYQKVELTEAINNYQEALKIDPRNLLALSNLAWIMATSPEASIRNGSKAVELAQQATRLAGNRNLMILQTLAAAYAEAGQFPQAIDVAQKTMDLAIATKSTGLAKALKEQLKLYQAGSPFRDTADTTPAH